MNSLGLGSRTASMMLLSFCLSGCAVGILSTNLGNTTVGPDETRLLNSVGYVLHSSTGNCMTSRKDEASWLNALAGFTKSENIFSFDADHSAGVNSYSEFSKTHPMVDIRLNSNCFEGGISGIFPILTIASLGIIPSYFSEPYTATFTLSIPGEKHDASLHWDYEYRRQQYLWLPLLPFANHIITQAGEGDNDTRWQVEEKRRLLLRFLADAKQTLQTH